MPASTVGDAGPRDGPVVVARSLSKSFGAQHRHASDQAAPLAVDDVSFSIPCGGSLGIVGESGSGKTTIARMLTGLVRPSGGTIVVAGQDRSQPARNSRERRRRGHELQMVFQDPYTSLDPRQRVAGCLEEALRLHTELGSAARVARIRELLEQVGLDERHARSLPRQLSGGQRQRVAIARALAGSPVVIVLDEAVSALDVSIQAQVLNLLNRLRADTGVAYVFISHNLAVVRQVCDDVLVLQHGRAVESGAVDDVLGRPKHEYTRRLLASIPGPGWDPHAVTGRVAQVPAADSGSGTAHDHPRDLAAQEEAPVPGFTRPVDE